MHKLHTKPHVSKYAARHDDAPFMEREPAKPVKEKIVRAPSPVPAFQEEFAWSVKRANPIGYSGEEQVLFNRVLDEAVMMKSTREALQCQDSTASERVARTVCENLYRRARDEAARRKDGAYAFLLNEYSLKPEIKDALQPVFAAQYEERAPALRAALAVQAAQSPAK